MDHDSLFLHSVKDLEASSKSEDPYTILKSSGVLRQLLLDNSPLVHIVNRERRLKVLFRVCGTSPPKPGSSSFKIDGYFLLSGLDPDTTPFSTAPSELKLEQFLPHVVGYIAGIPVTIRSTIRIMAHVYGGIHAFPPEDEAEQRLFAASSRWMVNHKPIVYKQTAVISRVVVKALCPLVDVIESERQSPPIG